MRSKKDPSDLRPITSRALTSAMDTLRPHLMDSQILDLYSGKGRFGLAALEEGAAHITFVEKHPRTSQALRKSVERWEDKAKVHQTDVIDFLKREGSYDIVFADPPFKLWNDRYAQMLFSSVKRVLGSEAIFLVRYPKRMVVSLPTQELTHWKASVFGESELLYLVK